MGHDDVGWQLYESIRVIRGKWRNGGAGGRYTHRLKGSTKGSKCAKIELMVRVNHLFI